MQRGIKKTVLDNKLVIVVAFDSLVTDSQRATRWISVRKKKKMEFSTGLLTLITLLITIYYFSSRLTRNVFTKKGIPHIRSIPILGHMAPVFFRRISMAELLQRHYNAHSKAKYFGLYEFTSPIICIRDPQLVQSIAVKHFDHFVDHRVIIDEKLDPLFGNVLFSLRGDKWRDVRKILSPAFTSSKMKLMFDLVRW